LLAGMLALPTGARAAFEVVVSASPSEVRVGQQVEILIRTFVPVERDILDVSDPRGPYPGPSGLWNVLYPMDDYPFDVVAEHEGGSEVRVALARDPSDSTLWRGSVSFQSPGGWTVRVRNFSAGTPGATTVVRVRPATPDLSESGPSVAFALALGLIVGAIVGLRWRRSKA
jgi:hypothetical protein